jgi:hypothetical protein
VDPQLLRDAGWVTLLVLEQYYFESSNHSFLNKEESWSKDFAAIVFEFRIAVVRKKDIDFESLMEEELVRQVGFVGNPAIISSLE